MTHKDTITPTLAPMFKKILLAAIIIASAATIISISATPNHLSMEHMTDNELKDKIDSLARLEQPLTAAPFIAEAKRERPQHMTPNGCST